MKVYMPCVFPEPLMTGWEESVELDVNRSGLPVSREEMKSHLQDADAVVINLDDSFDRELMDAAPQLKVITLFAESTCNIDLEYAKEKNITVCITPGEIFENTADLAFALLMAVARRIPEADAYIRKGNYRAWGPNVLLGADIYRKTLGLVGFGRIGQAVARRAKGFGMTVLYTTKHGPKPEAEKESHAQFASKEELLRRADFVSLHCKLTQETRHIIGPKELKIMKASAYLINTGRGQLVDEGALANILETHGIAGAALDVFENEPEVMAKLLRLPNVVMTPHLGASSRENRIQMAKIAAACTRSALKGNEPKYHA